jgi:hypothetical protein
MPEDAIRRMKTLTKKSVSGLTFGDRKNINNDVDDDDATITGVNDADDDNINPQQEHPYDIQILCEEDDDDIAPLQDLTPLNVHLKTVQEEEEQQQQKS